MKVMNTGQLKRRYQLTDNQAKKIMRRHGEQPFGYATGYLIRVEKAERVMRRRQNANQN